MSSILVINAAGRETRVALVENGHIAEFFLERNKDRGVVGNIYKGRVVRVLPGMQAAFVEIGLDKAAFLYVSDVVYDPDFARAQFELTEGEHEDAPEVPDLDENGFDHPAAADAEDEAAELDERELAHESALDAGASAGSPEHAEPVDRPQGEGESEAQAPSDLGSGVPPNSEAALGEMPIVPREASAQAPELPRGSEVPAVAAPQTTEMTPAPPATELSEVPPASEVPEVEVRAPSEAIAAGGTGGAPADALSAPPSPAAPASPQQISGERRLPREARDQRMRERRQRRDERRAKEHEEEKAKPRKSAKIEDLLKVGQEVVVQISKDPIGTKGARLTSHISIPGRHLVFMPTVDHVGISRRISNEKERRRLRELVDRLRPPGTGFIVRTVAENVPAEKLESDIRFLIEVWNQVVQKNERRNGPGLLHPDLDLILRATRDLFAQDVEKLVIDDRDEYERVLGFVTAQDPALRDRILLHDNDEPIFDAYGIEQEINRALQRKVWLKSGGYLIIDQAEALTAIDVNSGRYVGKKSLEETITRINVEAAKEIVYQLRLRNIGGIIICDFIDMEKPQNRDKVYKTLQEALGRDKAKTNVLRISELGLVEMTRKRVRESIGRMLHEDCGYCEGKGYVKTATTVAYQIFHDLRREAPTYKEPTLVINCNPDVASLLQGEERDELRHLMDRYNKSITVKAQTQYHREQYDIYGRSLQGTDHRLSGSTAAFWVGGSPPARIEADAGRPREGFRDRRDRERGDRANQRDRDRDRNRERRGDRNERRDRDRDRDRDRHRPSSGAHNRGEGHGSPSKQAAEPQALAANDAPSPPAVPAATVSEES